MEKEMFRSQFRLPQSLYEKLKAAAEKNRRSVNAELVARLEESFTSISSPSLKSKLGHVLVTNFDDIFERAIREVMQNSLDATQHRPAEPDLVIRQHGEPDTIVELKHVPASPDGKPARKSKIVRAIAGTTENKPAVSGATDSKAGAPPFRTRKKS